MSVDHDAINIMYSQNDEERFIVEFFAGAKGRFLDIGAFDGVSLSNTRRLLELGWLGVLVEPNPISFCKLMVNCASYHGQVKLVLAAIASGEQGLSRLHIDEIPDRGWSCTVNTDLFLSGSVREPSPLEVQVSVLNIFNLESFGPFDFICIDAEWEDFEILRQMAKPMLNLCKLLCIEPRSLEERAEMKAWFANEGMVVVYETPENLLVKWP